jgi:hypothetical protein
VTSEVTNTGSGDFTQDAGSRRSASASAVSSPMAYRASVALAEKVMKTRPLRMMTAGPSLTLKPWISHGSVGTAILAGAVASSVGEASRAM